MAQAGDPVADVQVAYFVTVRTFGCKSVFHEATSAATVVDVIETARRREGFKKYGYVVLPDHYHMLLGSRPDSRSVADVILSINAQVERFVQGPGEGQPLWDAEPEVLVLYTPRARVEKLNYIHSKPVVCGIVENAQDYAFSSARFYFERYGKTLF